MTKRQTFILTLLISLIAISKENHDDIISSLVDGTQKKINITCYCTGDERCDTDSETCRITDPDHACYESWTKIAHEKDIHVNAGCVYNEHFFNQIICHGNRSDHYIICCSDTDNCNDRDVYSNDIRKKLALLDKRKPSTLSIMFILFGIISSIILILSLIILILFRIKRQRTRSSNLNEKNVKKRLTDYLCFRSKSPVSDAQTDVFLDEASNGSSRCVHRVLEPYQFAKQIVLDKTIGVGAYGCVYRGKWYDDEIIAVKIFSPNDTQSWVREVYIYETLGLNHENILRYIAADNIDISNCIERWIATEYHENGSVYDYLMNHTITIPVMIKMMLSIASGLCHLHRPIDAARGKVALAHRDFKTKNILVKKDLSCCIADLGLAVKEKRQIRRDEEKPTVIDIIANHRAGTIRYMAPEILNKTLNDQSFESYKAADLYALGLVFWEILRRCQTTPEVNDADAYELPYEDVLPHNPTFEQMHEVVCVRKVRPSGSSRWENNSILQSLFTQCEELWLENPVCRPSSYRLQKYLREQSQSMENELLTPIIESRIEGPQTI